jgi:hypothetical protein
MSTAVRSGWEGWGLMALAFHLPLFTKCREFGFSEV